MNKKNCIDYLKKIKRKTIDDSFSMFLTHSINLLKNHNKETIFGVLKREIKFGNKHLEYYSGNIVMEEYCKSRMNISEFLLNNLEL